MARRDLQPPAFPARAAGNPFANQLREVFGKVRQRMQPTGLQGGQAQAPGARFQALADNAPVGSVGAPGGIQRPGQQPTAQDGLSALLTGGAMVPGPVGDVAGPLADAYMYATEPESRTLGNAAMSALGVLPGVPSLAGISAGKMRGAGELSRADSVVDEFISANDVQNVEDAYQRLLDDRSHGDEAMADAARALDPSPDFNVNLRDWLSRVFKLRDEMAASGDYE